VAAAGTLAAPQIKAQSKPEKLVYVGDNGPWHRDGRRWRRHSRKRLERDFTLLPTDPWRTRLHRTWRRQRRYRRGAVECRYGRLIATQ
jgi:hypothetical protein